MTSYDRQERVSDSKSGQATTYGLVVYVPCQHATVGALGGGFSYHIVGSTARPVTHLGETPWGH